MKKDIQTKRERKNITLTGVPETMLQTVFARAQETQKQNHKIVDEKALAALLPDFAFVEEHSLVDGMEVIAPVYRVIGKIPFVRNLSNKIIVLRGRQGHI